MDASAPPSSEFQSIKKTLPLAVDRAMIHAAFRPLQRGRKRILFGVFLLRDTVPILTNIIISFQHEAVSICKSF